MTFGQKIRDARKHKRFTQKELAGLIGAAHNSVSDWENDKNKPDPDTIELICGVLDIAPNYLLGKGEESITPFDKELIDKFHNKLDDQGRKTVLYIMDNEIKRTEQLQKIAKSGNVEMSVELVPTRIWAYYGKIASAGTSVEFTDMVAGTREYPVTEENVNADYTIGVNGDSMEDLYYDGDIVFVQKDAPIKTGEIGIFQKDNCIYIKELGTNALLSKNPAYKPMENGGDVIYLGKVIGKADDY